MNAQLQKSPIRVVLIEHQPLLREGMELLFARSSDIAIVGSAGVGDAALPLIAERQPDMIILDAQAPDMLGVDVAIQIRDAHPTLPLLIFTASHDVLSHAMTQIGVEGYLRKTASFDELSTAIRAVAQGWSIRGANLPAIAHPDPSPLTSREQEVMECVATGMGNRAIAATLCVSVRTVEFHISNILDKLAAHSRTDAIHKALVRGLIRPRMTSIYMA